MTGLGCSLKPNGCGIEDRDSPERQPVLFFDAVMGTAIHRQNKKGLKGKERNERKAKEMKVGKGGEKRGKSWRNKSTITFCVRRVR